jgi:hypothetical protein
MMVPDLPADFGIHFAAETAKWGKVAKFAGIKRSDPGYPDRPEYSIAPGGRDDHSDHVRLALLLWHDARAIRRR